MIPITIRFSSGAQREGVLLWLSELTIRVALRGADDVTELHCHSDQWFAENGDPVQIYVEAAAGPHSADSRAPVSLDHPLIRGGAQWLN